MSTREQRLENLQKFVNTFVADLNSQESTTDQLQKLFSIANICGLYDAADAIGRILNKEKNGRLCIKCKAFAAQKNSLCNNCHEFVENMSL